MLKKSPSTGYIILDSALREILSCVDEAKPGETVETFELLIRALRKVAVDLNTRVTALEKQVFLKNKASRAKSR